MSTAPSSNPAVVPLTRITPGRRALLLTLLAFVLPVAIGTGLYWSGWRPLKTGNHGELVQPPKPVPTTILGKAAAEKWLLVVAGDAACEAECVALLKNVRAVQVSLGRDIDRMRRVVLTGGSGMAETVVFSEFKGQQPDLIVAAPTPAWNAALAAGPRHRLFLVDPAGNLMMQYAPDTEPKFIRADLERLLKYSWIG